jgi:hypothetical protein
MIRANVVLQSAIRKLEKIEKEERPLTVARVAAYVRAVSIRSMQRAPGASKPGTPPNVHKGRLRRSIMFAVDTQGVADVGPAWSQLDKGGLPPYVGNIHEFGGNVPSKRRKENRTVRRYPARPYMRPALEKGYEKFIDGFKGTIGQ